MTDTKTFQKLITGYLIDTDTSKNELRAVLGITRPTYNKYWNDPDTMPVKVLSQICDYLNVREDERGRLI